tara:strand:+ start:604 stop:882 length:279 start_codon:yes stop_codon:yes gene_type:complete
LKVERYLKTGKIDNPTDVYLHTQTFAYIIAKHYGVSLQEVYGMDREMFKQSLVWAMAVDKREKRQQEKQNKQNNTGSEVVSVDYSFLDSEGF